MAVIEGNAADIPVADFRTKIQPWLDLLQSRAPQYYNWFNLYNLKIRAATISGASAEEIAHMQRQDGGHADLDGDGNYTWEDYRRAIIDLSSDQAWFDLP